MYSKLTPDKMGILSKKSFTYATRDAVEVDLEIIEGKIPKDLQGYVFFNSPCGTVNSGGLPFPEKNPDGSDNPEYGSSVFNGDSMLLRFDLSQEGKIGYKSKMLKPPCWYADDATKRGSKYYKDGQEFRMLGIARTSLKFGSRNELNTAINPIKFEGDQHVRMTANFDMGRPWEIDTETMELKTSIGTMKEWAGEMPQLLNYPFSLFQSTAHPCFDPKTKEFFTVNFTKTFDMMFFYTKFNKRMQTHHNQIEKKLHEHLEHLDKINHTNKAKAVNDFYKQIDSHIDYKKGFWNWITKPFKWLLSTFLEGFFAIGDLLMGMKNRVYLMRWDGSKIHQWEVIDEKTGKPIKIEQCMHQNNLSKDYIVLCDAAFKFSADIMITNPFPHNKKLEQKLRDITSVAQEAFTPIYIIKRSNLLLNSKKVKAKKVVINLETVHFSLDYENPDNKITIHTSHNAASCASEWIRPFDTLATTKKEVYPNTVGLMTCGEMDIGRIGKFVVNGETGEIEEDSKIHKKGNENGQDKLGAHTWAIALHTYRNVISATDVVDKIRHIYWQSYGTDPRYLTEFIEGLYHEYEHRIIPVQEMMEINRKCLPYCLSRQNTETMELEDAFVFEVNQNLRSLQFVPRKESENSNNGIDSQMDGYIFCTMIVGSDDFEVDEYSREIWIFDAADLQSGPVCTLSHPEMNFAFTIHSAWVDNCVSQQTSYKVNVREDLEYTIGKMRLKNRKFFTPFMEKYVYSHFE
jgi:hypothetical protein